MTPTGPVTLIPANRLDRAKGRLAELLTPAERARLALATLETVIAAARPVSRRVAVLTADETVTATATSLGCNVVRESPELDGLNGQIQGAVEALDHPADLLILHADLPLATSTALSDLVASAPPLPSVTIVRSGDGGTNALLLRPSKGFAYAYGRGSAALHLAAAERLGYGTALHASSSLTLDLDMPADVRAFLAARGSGETRAGRVLAEIGVAARLG